MKRFMISGREASLVALLAIFTLGPAAAAEPQWKTVIKRQMTTPITFDFNETQLDKAVDFLRRQTGINIFVDPEVIADGAAPQITMSVNGIKFKNALKWILRMVGLEYTLRDEAIFITTPENIGGDSELRFYEVTDLVMSVPDFPGPRISLAAGDEGIEIDDIGGEESTPEDIAELIQNSVATETWD